MKIFYAVFLFLLAIFIAVPDLVAQKVYNTPGTYNDTVPAGVTLLTVEVWGAGGAGGSRTGTGRSGGGGGGAYARSQLSVTPGDIKTVVVGAGGVPSTSGTPSGNSSSYDGTAVVAVGGTGVPNNTTTGGAGGLASASTGTVRFSGGTGGNGANGTGGGGGGGGAGSTQNGGNGTNNVGGAGGSLHGGNGGTGNDIANTSGNAGLQAGGGGSGIRRTTGTVLGAAGANGLVIVTYITTIQVNATSGISLRYYATLKAAFDAINAGTHTGAITIRINGSTTETASAILNASGSGAASYSSVTVFPTTVSLSVSGALTAPLIQLNGADNVRIDGRVNQAGAANLTISNTSTASGAQTIEFINSAQNNTVEYCIIRGAGTSATQGTINFSTSASGTGNDGNFIQYNNITSVTAGSRPLNAIYSSGTATRENSENTIRNNNIFDFLNTSDASNGIHIAGHSTVFSINGNSFYETTSLAPTAAVEYAIIRINNTSGANFIVSNNFFGGNASSATGTWTKTNSNNNTFSAINLNVGTTSSSVQGNTIRNFSYANSGAANWFGINVQGGLVNIGTVTGNIIGSDTGTGSVTFTAGATGASFNGIFVSSTNNVSISNNTIGSITTNTASAANANQFYGIFKAAGAGSATINNNLIGSLSTANSVQTASLATGNSQLLYAIYTLGTSTNTITGNTISNITNSTTETTLGSRVRGIFANAGSNSIRNNNVQFVKTAGLSNQGNYASTALVGISLISTTSGNAQEISGNDVHDLENNTTNTTLKFETYGIYYDGPSDVTGIISRNFVRTFIVPAGSSTGHFLHGISLFGGSYIASNNIVFMGNNIDVGCSLWGMWTNSVNNVRIYHNTVYLTGVALSGTSNSYALRVLSCPASLDVRNNILWDGRSNLGGGVSHFAIFLNCLTNATVNYNDYQFAQQFGRVGTTDYATLAAWQTGTSLDINSLEVDPQLVNLGGELPIDYQTGVQLQGVSIAGQTTDFDGVVRVAPTMGAWEFFPNPVEVWNGNIFRQAYTTLKGAFDAINSGTWTGNLTIIFRGNTTETSTAELNASGTGAANYSRVLIYPGRSGIKVTGNLAAPVVSLNGARNVTFDGRVNGTGTPYEFTVTNTNTSNTSGNSTIRLINNAETDTLRYCVIRGATTATVGGVVYFATSTATHGNNNNVLFSNRITSVDADRPQHMIYSEGTSAKANTGNKIESNSIFNFFRTDVESHGIHIGNNSTTFSILNNSFYQTSSFVPSASVIHRVIHINNTSGYGFVVSGNHIGGNSPNSTGTWSKTNAQNNEFYAISVNAGTSSPSSVQGNTIRNISYANSGAANWFGIHISAGAVNIGTTLGNTIGGLTGTGSVLLTNGATGGLACMINIASSGAVNVENNNIGSVTTNTANAAHAFNLIGVQKTATAGATGINKNTIGSSVTADSFRASSTSTGNAQVLYGIYSQGTGVITINENIIANNANSTTNTTAGTRGRINGIWVDNGSSNNISKNQIYNLTIANANTANDLEASVIGLNLTNGVVPDRIISENLIYGLSNTFATYSGMVVGLYYRGATTGNNEVRRNFIHSLTATSSSGQLFGIVASQGVTTYSNNIVSLGGTVGNTLYGFFDVGASLQTCNVYFNTMYIGGVTSGTNNSFAFYSAAASNTRNYRNNIFVNARSRTGGSGSHFAIYYNATGVTNLTVDYNDYWVSGTGGVLAFYSTNRTTLGALQTALGPPRDVNSQNFNPLFVNAGTTVAADYKIGISLNGISGTGIIIDYGNFARPGTGPTMGAWERNVNRWKGNISEDWNTASNWTGNLVPAVDANIEFDPLPERHCVMDQNRSVTNIVNAQGTYRVVTNGFRLTIKGDLFFSGGAQIDASANGSTVEFAGNLAQTIPSGSFLNNGVFNLNINNPSNVILSGSLRLLNNITASAGRIELAANGTTFIYGGTTAQSIPDAIFQNSQMHNLEIDNAAGVSLNTDITVNNNLTINASRRLTINPERRMTVSGTVTNNAGTGGLIIKSSSTQPNGSFVFFNPFGNPVPASVEMYSKATFDLSQPPLHRYNWQFFGIPLRSIQADPTFSGSFVRRKVEFGQTVSTHWRPLTNDSVLIPFVGYEVVHQNPKTIYFAGNLVNHNFNSGQLPFTSGALYPGQHLFSNPYTAAIDIRQIEMGSGSDGAVYLYNTGTYAAWDTIAYTSGSAPGQYVSIPKNLAGLSGLPLQVPSMSSMLFRFSSNSVNNYVNLNYNDVVMKNNDMQRVKGTQTTFREDFAQTLIEVSGESGLDRLWVFSNEKFTGDFDWGYDGRKVAVKAAAPIIYAIGNNDFYQVNALKNIHNMPIGFIAGRDSVYNMVFYHDNIELQYSNLYLHDRLENRIIDITEDGAFYKFNAVPDSHDAQRFRILTQPTGLEQNADIRLQIFSYDNTVYVRNASDRDGEMVAFDLSGRIIRKMKVSANSLTSLAIPYHTICIVRVVTPEHSLTQSVVLK